MSKTAPRKSWPSPRLQSPGISPPGVSHHDLCQLCKVCANVCPFYAMVMRHFAAPEVFTQIDSILSDRPLEKIVAFACNWCSYAGGDLAGTSRLQLEWISAAEEPRFPRVMRELETLLRLVTPAEVEEARRLLADVVPVAAPPARPQRATDAAAR